MTEGGRNAPPILNGAPYVFPTKTLAQLRDDLLCILGFPDPLTAQDSETKTLAELRAMILKQLGFPDPLTDPDSETKTLVQLRELVIRSLGHMYQAGSNPPGVDELADKFVNEAQQTIFRLAELDKGGVTFPAQMSADSDPTEIDYVPVLALAIGLAKAHYGQQDSQAYFEQLQKYLKDREERRPPDIEDQIDQFINEAQQQIFRMVEMDKAGVAFPAVMTLDADPTEIDYVPILAMATGSIKALYEQKDFKIYFDQLEKYLRDRAMRRPPNIVDMCTKWLQLAQTMMYAKYRMLRNERWWKIPLTIGERIYEIPAISSGYQTDISFDAGARTITRVSGNWFEDGFTEGMRVKAYGATNAGNNNVQWTIDSMTATVLTMVAGDTLVTESAGASVAVNSMNYINVDARRITEAWLEDEGTWHKLRSPFSAGMFNVEHNTIPSHFEIREYFEIAPNPDKAYNVFIKGHFGLLPFEADNDTTSMDWEAVLFQATVMGKQHFQQRDAMQYEYQLRDLIGRYNAGLFAGKRFIPDPNEPPHALSYPQVTGTGWDR